MSLEGEEEEEEETLMTLPGAMALTQTAANLVLTQVSASKALTLNTSHCLQTNDQQAHHLNSQKLPIGPGDEGSL